MNQRIVICTIILFAPMYWAQPEDHENTPNPLFCVENITIPRYNPLARQARLTGTVTANIWLGNDGSKKVTIEEKAHKPLAVGIKFIEQLYKTWGADTAHSHYVRSPS